MRARQKISTCLGAYSAPAQARAVAPASTTRLSAARTLEERRATRAAKRCMTVAVFVDTNVLVYARDASRAVEAGARSCSGFASSGWSNGAEPACRCCRSTTPPSRASYVRQFQPDDAGNDGNARFRLEPQEIDRHLLEKGRARSNDDTLSGCAFEFASLWTRRLQRVPTWDAAGAAAEDWRKEKRANSDILNGISHFALPVRDGTLLAKRVQRWFRTNHLTGALR